jgi:hypothetical protein
MKTYPSLAGWPTPWMAALAALLTVSALGAATSPPPTDWAVVHEVHEPHPLPAPGANDVLAVAVAPQGRVWAATQAGVFSLPRAGADWAAAAGTAPQGPVFAIATDRRGVVWAGAWNGLLRIDDSPATLVSGVKGPINAVAVADDRVLAAGPDGCYLARSNAGERVELACPRYVNRLVPAPDGIVWIATRMGLYQWWHDRVSALEFDRETLSADVRGLALDERGTLWAGTLGGVQVFRDRRFVRQMSPADGLPSADVRCVARDENGRVWVGTAEGVARWDSERWTVRRAQRWLLDNDVRDIALAGATAWVATAQGVSELRSETLTLAEKARRFQKTLETRHVRPPGLVGQCRLAEPGDLASWQPTDDDNEGGYTAVYLAMESFRFAASRDPEALDRARRALTALEFLVDVTGTNGFLARTVVPANSTEMHDPNVYVTPPEWAKERIGDPRAKYVRMRWRESADGRWLWKGDTSSDEMTAHMFGYFVFHDLAATAPDRSRVRRQVCRLVDHLIANGFVLRDVDGQPTRWGIWSPEHLNSDPNWAMERGINSLEMLSFLRLAHHVSQDAKYLVHYHRLIAEHHYDRNVREAPNLNPAWRTHIDLELLAFAYPALLRLETDARLRSIYRQSLERWHEAVRDDRNPFFEFVYAAVGDPKRARLDDALAFLRDTPLDLVRWEMDNRSREDLRPRRSPELEEWQADRWLPPSEISYSRTDQNPWLVVQGDGGRKESDGVFWLLPYWMGRHHGWVPGPVDARARDAKR